MQSAVPEALAERQVESVRMRPCLLVMALMLPAIGLLVMLLNRQEPGFEWLRAVLAPDEQRITDLVIAYSLLPRAAVALLCGAALGLSGAMFQLVLRNRLAEPTTLGVSAGASLALILANLWFPDMLGAGQELIALTGAGIGCLLVFLIARRQRLSPQALITVGLVLNLYCGSLAALAALYNHDYLANVFLWQSGSLHQSGWSGATYLLPRLAVAWLFAFATLRAITLLGLGDGMAGAVGLSVQRTRIAILAVAVMLGGFVVSAVGLIGFVGLVAPNLAHLSGARTPRQQLVWSPLVGSALLCLADGLAQLPSNGSLSTGVVTAFLGAPILLLLLARTHQPPVPASADIDEVRAAKPARQLLLLAAALIAVALTAIVLGRDASGWRMILPTGDGGLILQWRWPRVLSAAAAGALLALAGSVLQRATGNPMASPEILGISSGASLGYIAQLILLPRSVAAFGLLGAGLGAGFVLFALVFTGRRSAGGHDRTLLIGVALTTVCGAMTTAILAAGGPALPNLMGWLIGATTGATATRAVLAAAAAAIGLAMLPLVTRWLCILPLGAGVSRSLGMPSQHARLLLLAFCAIATAAASLLIGPMSFVGLMAPHIARRLGLSRAGLDAAGAALLGALLLVSADWLGRTAIFPWELPAGLVCAFIGGPCLMWLMQRRAT